MVSAGVWHGAEICMDHRRMRNARADGPDRDRPGSGSDGLHAGKPDGQDPALVCFSGRIAHPLRMPRTLQRRERDIQNDHAAQRCGPGQTGSFDRQAGAEDTRRRAHPHPRWIRRLHRRTCSEVVSQRTAAPVESARREAANSLRHLQQLYGPGSPGHRLGKNRDSHHARRDGLRIQRVLD